jgi:hypothetical protein
MHGEDLLVNDRCNGKAVEAVRERLPQFDVVPPLAFVVETIDSVDGGALVIPPKDEEVLWVLDLVGKEQADRLQGLLSSIDVVSQEEIVCFGREPSVLKQAQEVVILTMNVPAYLA